MMDWLDANFITILNGLAFGLLLYTLSVGLSLILGAMSVLNMAHGMFYLAGSYVVVAVVGSAVSWPLFLAAIGLSAVVGVLLGGGLAVLAIPLVKRGHQAHTDQALLTLGIALIGAHILLMGFGGDARMVSAPPGLNGSIELFGHLYPRYRLFLIGFGLILVLLLTYMMERTPLGALVRATVADPEMVRALGIDTRKVIVGILSLGSALAVAGGVLGGPFLGAYPGQDWTVLIIALVVVVVGGMGSVKGAFVGAIIIGQVQILGTALIPSIAPFLLLGSMSFFLLVRPNGILGDVQTGK